MWRCWLPTSVTATPLRPAPARSPRNPVRARGRRDKAPLRPHRLATPNAGRDWRGLRAHSRTYLPERVEDDGQAAACVPLAGVAGLPGLTAHPGLLACGAAQASCRTTCKTANSGRDVAA